MRDFVADFAVDMQRLGVEKDAVMRAVFTAGTKGVRETTKGLERKLEALNRDAVPGRLWRAWASRTYPAAGAARDPGGIVYLNGRDRTQGAMRYWTTNGRVTSKTDGYLAIPLPAAGSTGRGRNLTPGEWERRTGIRLRYFYRPGRRAHLLIADMGTTNKRTGAFRPITRARTAADERRGYVRGAQTVPIFVLIPSVPFANAFSVEQATYESQGELAKAFFDLVRTIK